MLCPIILIVRFIENKPFTSLGFSKKFLFENFLLGLGTGLFFSLEAVLTKRLKYGKIFINSNHLSSTDILSVIILSMITAFIEETVYRGYFLSRLMVFSKNFISANFTSSFFFALVHLPLFIFVDHYTLRDFLSSFLIIFILGLVNGILFFKTKNITASIISHSVWNISTYLF